MIRKICATILAIVLTICVVVPITANTTRTGDDTLCVVVLVGQSNVAYIPSYMDLDVVNEDVPLPTTNCYYFGTSSFPISGSNIDACSIWPMVVGNKWRIGGEECSLAYGISEKTNDDVLVINVGDPGRPISYFEPTNDGGKRIQAILDRALNLIDDKYVIKKVGWIWGQGESDKTTPIEDYVSSFTKIDHMMKDNGFDKCWMIQTKPIDSGYATQSQEEIVDSFKNVNWGSKAPDKFTVQNGGLIEGNSLHWSQSGRIEVGYDCAEQIVKILPTHPRSSVAYELLELVPIFIVLGVIIGLVAFTIHKRT